MHSLNFCAKQLPRAMNTIVSHFGISTAAASHILVYYTRFTSEKLPWMADIEREKKNFTVSWVKPYIEKVLSSRSTI